MPQPRIALVTYSGLPHLYDDDRLLLTRADVAGLKLEPMRWDATVDWCSFDAAVVRSTWDYWTRYAEFSAWIQARATDGTHLFNPPRVILDNTHKSYLKRLSGTRVATVPTLWIERITSRGSSNLRMPDWAQVQALAPEVVVKPTVSGGGHLTTKVLSNDQDAIRAALEAILADAPEDLAGQPAGRPIAMIQPLVPTIITHGEISFFFFNYEFSHAVLKCAQGHEFRIQRTFGGTSAPYSAQPSEIGQARAALDTLYPQASSELLYARVDMVRSPGDPGQLLLMEMEVTEPNLFFLSDGEAPKAADFFLAALKTRLRG